MRILEVIADSLMNTRLFEMAFERRAAKNRVTDLSPQIFDHLLKLWVLDSPRDANHWKSEINTWLRSIDQIYLKPSKKKPSYQDLHNWMLLDAAPHYAEEYVTHVISIWRRSEYKNVPLRDFDVDITLAQIFQVISQVCKDISANKFITIDDYL